MTFTLADAVTLLTVLISLYVAITNGRKTSADAKASEAQAVTAYADAAAKMATLGKDCHEEIEALSARMDEKEKRVAELERQVLDLRALLETKDRRIAELEKIVETQEKELQMLRSEMDRMLNG